MPTQLDDRISLFMAPASDLDRGRDRAGELTSAAHVYEKAGRYVEAVKVIDIFGNDTMSPTPVTVG